MSPKSQFLPPFSDVNFKLELERHISQGDEEQRINYNEELKKSYFPLLGGHNEDLNDICVQTFGIKEGNTKTFCQAL